MAVKNKLNVVGIMNGTSMDGIDFVLCEIQKSPFKIKFKDKAKMEFTDELRFRLVKAAKNELEVAELAHVHHDLGNFYAEAFKSLKAKKKWKVDLIGLHGQTVYHKGGEATLQIGEPSYLALAAKVPVIADFRVADIAAGGQGAPLATIFHQQVFSKIKSKGPIAVNNLGGISNVSYFNGKQIFSFDTGPANMPIDMRVKRVTRGDLEYDKDGALAVKGLPHQDLINEWLKDPYFSQKPPKSCGREQFGEIFLNNVDASLKTLSFEDQIATLTDFVAQSIALNYESVFTKTPSLVILCGGGALNSFLRKRIQFYLPKSKVITSTDLEWPVDAIEGGAFALLAAFRVWKVKANLPSTTGANQKVLLGKIIEV